MPGTELSYCARHVRAQDRDRYLTALFAPGERREDLFALYAFNLEVAKTAEVVSETMIGRVRLQWWRDCLEETYAGRPRHHAVAGPLAKAFCSEAYFKAAGDSIQLHGGIGFTWEHDAHLYFKRAKSTELLLGSPARQRARLAEGVGL